MSPAPGAREVRFVGDRVRITLRFASGDPPPPGWTAFVRTNLGRSATLYREILGSHGGERPLTGASWCDIPMALTANGWVAEFTLTEVGFFESKAYAADPRGWQVWPEGPNLGFSVHPNTLRSANTIYCAFTRLFGTTRGATSTDNPKLETSLKRLEKQGYAVLPPSGTFRDLARELPHIIDTLGCRILHLLPVGPTPTTYARFGRFGSPYACLDLTAIDPALVEFDRKTTGIDQFRELAYAVHARSARLFLDIVINHTGWGSSLQENQPGWFVRQPDGTFVSPGAWGTTWEDLVELDSTRRDLWEAIAASLLVWCRRGVDGFRCDAGYKVPAPVWQYIVARVREEFPDTVFLLEGLGGGWQDTERLLTEGGMQWAYSELFQEYDAAQVARYLDHALVKSREVGVLVHYSETHDNDRLARKGRVWSLLRNRLCALTSAHGAYAFTCGVEWLATEKIRVHGATGLAWGNPDNLVAELGRLNRLLADHPCFRDGATLTRLSAHGAPVYALLRECADRHDRVLVLVNPSADAAQSLELDVKALEHAGLPTSIKPSSAPAVDLLDQPPPALESGAPGFIRLTLAPGACHCLAPSAAFHGLPGEAYRRARAQAGWAIQALGRILKPENIGPHDWPSLAALVDHDPAAFLGALAHLNPELTRQDLLQALNTTLAAGLYPQVVEWSRADRRRITPIPPGHWLLVRDSAPFRATLELEHRQCASHVESVPAQGGHIACFGPLSSPGEGTLSLERYADDERHTVAAVRLLSANPATPPTLAAQSPKERAEQLRLASRSPLNAPRVLLTNGRGGMARVCIDLGRVTSKYDCLLGANLHASLPVDRHVFAKRVRIWANANGLISPLNADNLADFEPGPPARWRFAANAGDSRTVEIGLSLAMLQGHNTTVLTLERSPDLGNIGASDAPIPLSLSLRIDLEDRNFHWETRRNGGADHHFTSQTQPLAGQPGFTFTPAPDRRLRVQATAGEFHAAPEWSENLPHPVEASRGQTPSGDGYSPGWFEIPLQPGDRVHLSISADAECPTPAELETSSKPQPWSVAPLPDAFAERLTAAARAFVVRRDHARSVIAGYPWFLDWGRDTLICARGLLSAGMTDEVRQLLLTFARFEERGTLPNTIHGDNASNRDTSDAPLWFGIACEDWAAAEPGARGSAADRPPYNWVAGPGTRTIAEVLHSIGVHCQRGTPNGIRMDPDSALLWSPSHFTWMDTNHPAGTPREGYPVEIQVLWIRLLRQLQRLDVPHDGQAWATLADRAERAFLELFWLEPQGWLADVLIASPGVPACKAQAQDALRSNGLLAVSLGLLRGDRARRLVQAAARHLFIPGALRSLAPLPVNPPLAIHAADGRLLNVPDQPYWGRYEGDEDTSRKPAYHNGTAWVWTLPGFCEALALAWDRSPEAVAAARACLASTAPALDTGCLGQLPEVLDGDAPHQERGCDAQAWSVTETLRVWRLLNQTKSP